MSALLFEAGDHPPCARELSAVEQRSSHPIEIRRAFRECGIASGGIDERPRTRRVPTMNPIVIADQESPGSTSHHLIINGT